jgi:acetyl esterase/lipase
MIFHRLSDYDDAYANGANIARADDWGPKWTESARAFREFLPAERRRLGISYGSASSRQNFDLFLPEAEPHGLVVFIHGGYWLRNDNSLWSHLASGPLARGHAVAMPTYRLCPEVRIGEIVGEIAVAIEAAARLVAGPLVLTGHSAGGHLASRMLCVGSPLSVATLARVERVVSISGVHDLRPLLQTAMKEPLRLDPDEARRESPVLLEPVPGTKLVCWVGGAERAEFRRQNALLANVWTGLGAATAAYEATDKHHFSVVDDLEDPGSGLVSALLD